jgi:CRISPR-associated protein Cmr1
MFDEGRSLTMTLETVTPLFLGGVDPRGMPELRAPSFRGAMRYWWRVWYTSQRADLSRDELYTAESAIFGSTEAASPILVRLHGQPATTTLERPEQPTGLNYLMYGMHERRKKQGKTVLEYRPAIKPGEHFDLILGTRPTQDADKALRQAAISLWSLCNLSGVGARVRRGAGALRAAGSVDNWPKGLPPLDLQASSPADLSQKLGESLKHLVGDVAKSKITPIPSLHPDLCIVSVFEKVWSSWEDALEEVGQAFQHFRSRRNPDYTGVKQLIQTGTPPETVERAAFGLPLQFYYRSLGGSKAMVDGQDSSGQTEITRSASPLRFRVVRLSSSSYAVLLLIFIVPLLPRKYQLRLTSQSYTESTNVPGQGVIAEFLKYAGEQIAPLWEVKY